MHAAAHSINNEAVPAAGKKGARRSPANWVKGYPRRISNRVSQQANEPAIVRFPTPSHRGSRRSNIERDARLVSDRWSAAEREHRKLMARQKQEELLMLLACADLEGAMRIAVADSELPVVLPEVDLLRN